MAQHLHAGHAEADVAVVFETPGDEVLEYLMLRVDGDGATVREFVEVNAVATTAEPKFDAVVSEPSRLIRSPSPVSISRSTVFCSSTPARIVPSTSSRVRVSSTTESMPFKCRRWDSINPAGPPPTIPTCVFMRRLLA